MFRKDQWPFTPVCLTEIIDKDTLSVIEAGCGERMERPLTILNYDPQSDNFSEHIYPIHPVGRFEDFCRLLRDSELVQGGEEACRESNRREAKKSLDLFRSEGVLFRTFTCHVGVQEATYVVQVCGHPVALLYSGQGQPDSGVEAIRDRARRLSPRSGKCFPLSEQTREELLSAALNLPRLPSGLLYRLQREAEFIQQITEAEYHQKRYLWEEEFLESLRTFAGYNRTMALEELRAKTQELLEKVRTFCRFDYVAFFASMQRGDVVLAPIAASGPAELNERELPHFNWKKAGLPVESIDFQAWDLKEGRQMGIRGIRGENSVKFTAASCVIPTTLGSRYRGLLLLGPSAEPYDLHEEERFLHEVANVIGTFVLSNLEIFYLEEEQHRWKSTVELLNHQLRTALTPIVTQIGMVIDMGERMHNESAASEITGLLHRTEDLCLNVRDSTSKTIDAHVLHLEPEDLKFERYPLSVLVANCAQGFAVDAEKKSRKVVLDESVELLPEAEVDVARLTITLSNLLENAIKYSYPHTTIDVRANPVAWASPHKPRAVIEVENVGFEIPEEELGSIFEKGTRGLTAVKFGRIPGSGLGLWEARSVLEAHGGEIGVTCEKVYVHRLERSGYLVVFTVSIPLRQSENKRR